MQLWDLQSKQRCQDVVRIIVLEGSICRTQCNTKEAQRVSHASYQFPSCRPDPTASQAIIFTCHRFLTAVPQLLTLLIIHTCAQVRADKVIMAGAPSKMVAGPTCSKCFLKHK
jgi:hypothetical protein